jgi:ketosteroid isomerase-like protein
MSISKTREFIQSFFEAMSEGDTDAIVNAYHPEGRVETMGNTLISGSRGLDEIKSFAPAVLESFPNKLKFTIKNITAEDNRVAVEAESTGEHVSGQHYNNQYHFLFELKDEKIYRLKEYMDTELVTDILCGGQRPG